MDRKQVISSNLKSVGYQGSTLEIAFNSGDIYQHEDVPMSVYEVLMPDPSKGKYFHRNIRNRYAYIKVGQL